jgi:hypothetical protein
VRVTPPREGNAFRTNLYGFVFDAPIGFMYNHIGTHTNPSSGGQEMDANFCGGSATCP